MVLRIAGLPAMSLHASTVRSLHTRHSLWGARFFIEARLNKRALHGSCTYLTREWLRPRLERAPRPTDINDRAARPLSVASLSGQQVQPNNKKKVVFLGTPEVAAGVLDAVLHASQADDSCFEVPAVITMPPARRGRGRALLPSPVGQLAVDRGMAQESIWCPATAKEPEFLSQLRALEPDLCVTAAYGNVLPNDFLAIPRRGTVNIHPSLLPLYRGASPVPRAIEHGVLETGVTLAFTVQRMDAGPVIATEVIRLDDDVQAPELLQDLFVRGTGLLLREMPSILSGDAATRARPQDEAKATKAAKLSKEEGMLAFLPPSANAWAIHNRVRAFAGWPGTNARFGLLPIAGSGEPTELLLKVVRTRCPRMGGATSAPTRNVALVDDALRVVCGDGTVLQVTEVQPPNKRAMAARDFWNGLRGQSMICLD